MLAVQKIYKSLFLLLVFLAPCTGIFALGPWLRLPVIVLLLLLLLFPFFCLSDLLKGKFHVDRLLLLILAFLMVSFVSLVVNYQAAKNLTNWLPYNWLFLLNFLFVRYLIRNNVCGINLSSVLSAVRASYIAIAIFIVIDFILVNLFEVQLRTYMVNLDNGSANMDYFFRSDFTNTGGVAEEPGVMSMMINTFFFITLFSLRNQKKGAIQLFYGFHFLVLMALGSTMGIVSFLLAMILVSGSWKLTVSIAASLLLLLLLLPSALFEDSFLAEMTNKLMMSDDLESSYVRATLWAAAYENFINNPLLGAGPGFGKLLSDDGFMSFFLILLAELGLVCFLLFILLVWEVFRQTGLIFKHFHTNALKMGLVCATVHIAIINEFYHLPYWFLLALVYCIVLPLQSKDKMASLPTQFSTT